MGALPQPQQGVEELTRLLAQVVQYCVAERCRRAQLLAHFGEALPTGANCGSCDWCNDSAAVSLQVCRRLTQCFR